MARPTIQTHPVAVEETGHLTEFLYDDGENDDALVCAGHGGAVEPGTAEQAIELATRTGATCWATLGFDDGDDAFDRWHPPSTAIDPEDYPLLAEIADRGFGTVVSLHGLADDRVIVGGGIETATKERVADRLRAVVDVPVRTASTGEYAGVHPENFVNWLAADGGGLQIEQGPSVRGDPDGAVVEVLERILSEGSP